MRVLLLLLLMTMMMIDDDGGEKVRITGACRLAGYKLFGRGEEGDSKDGVVRNGPGERGTLTEESGPGSGRASGRGKGRMGRRRGRFLWGGFGGGWWGC